MTSPNGGLTLRGAGTGSHPYLRISRDARGHLENELENSSEST